VARASSIAIPLGGRARAPRSNLCGRCEPKSLRRFEPRSCR
jgi:hypothetical protein